MPSSEHKNKLKKELMTKLPGLTLTQIRWNVLEQVIPQIKAYLYRDWSENDMFNKRNEGLVKIIETEKKLKEYFDKQNAVKYPGINPSLSSINFNAPINPSGYQYPPIWTGAMFSPQEEEKFRSIWESFAQTTSAPKETGMEQSMWDWL